MPLTETRTLPLHAPNRSDGRIRSVVGTGPLQGPRLSDRPRLAVARIGTLVYRDHYGRRPLLSSSLFKEFIIMASSLMHVTRARLSIVLGVIVLAVLAFTPHLASAHETRTVGTDYEFVVGFINEPAIQGDTNGIWLRITKGGQPVMGAAETLQAQVGFGDQVKDLTLSPAHGEDGVYESVFIPTEPGDYSFRFAGNVEGVAVDETFTSSPEGFDSVRPRSELEFPAVDAGSADRRDGSRDLAFPVIAGGLVLATGTVGFALRRRPS